MRIFIFSNRDLASNYHLNLILPHLFPYVKGVFLSDAVGKKTTIVAPAPLREMKFWEQHFPNDFLFPALDAQNRELNAKLLTFNELERKFNIPFASCNDVKSPKSIEMFKALAPDIVLSVRFGKIFGDAFIGLPTQGILNLHSGLLPNYRGVLASFRALQHGDKKLTTTLHWIDSATIDTGKIIGFSSVSVQTEKSLLSNILTLYPASIDLTLRTIQQIIEGKKEQIPNILNEGGAYFSFPSTEELEDFINMGWKMTDLQEMKAFYENYYV